MEEIRTSPGGVRVFSVDKFKTARLSLLLAVPANGREMVENLLLLLCARRGTEVYENLAAINRRLDDLYAATLSCRHFMDGDRQVLGFTAEYIEPDFLPDATDTAAGVAEVLAQLLLHPKREADGTLLRGTVAREKQDLVDSIRARRNDTRTYADTRCRELFFAGEPNDPSLLWSDETVLSVTPEELTVRMEVLLRDACISFFYTGREAEEAVRRRLTEVFGRLCDRCEISLPVRTERGIRPVQCAEEALPVTQSVLSIGYRAPLSCVMGGCDYEAFLLLNEMLGVMGTNRLFLRVREQMGLCYSIGSAIDCKKAALFVSCGIRAQAYEAVRRAIGDEIRAIADGRFTDEELAAAKQSVDNSLMQLEDSPGAKEAFIYTRLLDGLPIGVAPFRFSVAAVDRDAVMRVASALAEDTVFFLRGTQESEEETEDQEETEAYVDDEV